MTPPKCFEGFIDRNPGSPLAKIAFTASAHAYRRIDDLRGKSDFMDMKNFLTEVIVNGTYPALIPQAERLMIDYSRLTKDFNGAIETADNLVEKYKNDPDYLCGVLYAKGLTLAHDLNQPDKAAESFSLILQLYPENGLSSLAENELQVLGAEYSAANKPAPDKNISIFSTSSFPNPFNPITTIKFTLPVSEKVVIKVYDILGREVAELLNEEKQSGTYSVTFNASHLSSGVYFYSITAGNFRQVKKLVLAK